MIGLLVALLLSWLLLWVVAREPLTVLGIIPNRRRAVEFLGGLLFLAAAAVIDFTWQAHFQEIHYEVNPDYGLVQLLGASYWTLRAVLFEEVVFRGALLYLLIRSLGTNKACLLGALAFGIYHWFSYGVLGDRLIVMIYVLLVTGSSGWMFAFAFAKTKSLFAPAGLHFGWNLVSIVVFSSGPLGDQWLLPRGEAVERGGWVTLLFFSLQAIVLPGIVTWYLHRRSSVDVEGSSGGDRSSSTATQPPPRGRSR